MFNLRRGEKGFTLIEIMVVLVILGVLATISVPVYTNSVRKAKISEAISNVGSYGTAIRIHKMEKGDWPQTKPDGAKCPDFDDIDLNENYFTLKWTKPANKDTNLDIIVTTNNFDVSGSITYRIYADTLKGEWQTSALLTKYAPYVL